VLYRRLGRTNFNVSVFSLGGMRFQESWLRGAEPSETSQKNLEATLDRGLELGINHVETARGYGTSEAQLGPALARHPREHFLLQTKVLPTADAKEFETHLEESFRLLRVEHLDLFAVHGVNNQKMAERTLAPGGCLEVAERWRRQGRIRALGFSTHAATPLILHLIDTGRFDYVNFHYYYFFQDNHAVLEAAQRRDMGVFIISPSDKGGRLYRAPAKLRSLCAPLSPMVFNDLWTLAQPGIHTLSLGAARPSDFDEHLKTVELLPQADALLPPIVERLQAAYRAAVGDDFAVRWREGLPEWDTLPGKINVRRILWLRNLAVAYDMLEFAQERYASLDPDDLWVPGARAESFDEAAMSAALPNSPFRDRIPALLREAHQLLWNPKVRPQP
jgi:predicted aldo/keto reductase-like oxidoreductase